MRDDYLTSLETVRAEEVTLLAIPSGIAFVTRISPEQLPDFACAFKARAGSPGALKLRQLLADTAFQGIPQQDGMDARIGVQAGQFSLAMNEFGVALHNGTAYGYPREIVDLLRRLARSPDYTPVASPHDYCARPWF